MKLITLFAFLLSTQVFALNVATTAPNFKLMGDDSKTHTLKEYAGKIVVLEWFNEGCPFVKKHYESNNMQKLQENYTKKGIIWLSIISSAKGKQGYRTVADVSKIQKKWNIKSSNILFDPEGKVGKLYGAKTTPHMFIVNREGKIVYQGAIDSKASTDPADIPSSTNYVDQALKQVMSHQKIKVGRTSPYGCSVKY